MRQITFLAKYYVIHGIFPVTWEVPSRVEAETKHVWLDLCAEAAICEDPKRLGQLSLQINDVLRKEQERLVNGVPPASIAVEMKLRERGIA